MHKATRVDNTIGWIGALLVVVAYIFLTFEIVGAKDVAYNVMNLLGGASLGYRVWVDRNYSNFFLEIVFIGVAIYAIAKAVV